MMTNCKYCDIDEIQNIKSTPNSLSLFHLNTFSLNKNFDDQEYLNKTTNQTFDVTDISKSRIKVILILQLTLIIPTI